MVKLLCAIVGASGSVFSVDIDTSQMVGNLKQAIKAKKSTELKDVNADELQLFLAKTMDNKWLSSRLEDVKKLKNGEQTPLIVALMEKHNELQAGGPLEDVLDGMDPPSSEEIHVLVVVPSQNEKAVLSVPTVLLPRTTELYELETFAEKYIPQDMWDVPAVHKIPSIWKFMSKLGGCTKTGQFFCRTDDKKVAGLVMDGWFRESSPNNVNYLAGKRSIVMGSSGIGKSTLLCLIAFYLVFKHKKNVLVYRDLVVRQNCLFYLGYENDKVVQFTLPTCDVQKATDIYKELVRRQGRSNVWLLLDGFRYRDIPEGMRTFKLLTTSHRVDLLPQEQEGTYTCLLPSWSKTDLFSMGGLIHKFSPEDMEKRYYYSGGSVRVFTRATSELVRNSIDTSIGFVSDVSKLLSNPFSMLWWDEADCLCHTFWINPTKSLIHVENWVQVIDSEYAVSVLQTRLGSVALSTIYKWAKKSGNTSLAETAFKIYLHRLAIDNTLELHISEYDLSTNRKPNDSRPVQVEGVQLKEGRITCSGTANAHMDELIRWRDDEWYAWWFPRCQDFPNIDSIVKLESGNVAYLHFSVAADEKIDTEQLHQMNAIFSAAGNAEPPTYIAVCPDLKSCQALVLNPQSEVSAANKVCRVYVGYSTEDLLDSSKNDGPQQPTEDYQDVIFSLINSTVYPGLPREIIQI